MCFFAETTGLGGMVAQTVLRPFCSWRRRRDREQRIRAVRYTTYRPVGYGMDDMPDCLVKLNHDSSLASLSRCCLCRPRPSASDYRQQLASEASCLGVMKLHSSSRHIVRILSYRPISTTYRQLESLT